MRKQPKIWLICLFSLFFWLNAAARNVPDGPSDLESIAVQQLPKEAQRTLALIRQGGPFPFEQDGKSFGNYERILPAQKRGYYREFTVKTPGKRNRGARRIVAGGYPPAPTEFFYTEDHYATFKRIRE